MSAADVTRAMLADLNSLKGGPVFDATQVDSFCNETSERNPFGDGYNLRSARDPIGYTRATPDPKLGTMAKPCVVLCTQNGSKAKALRCKDFRVAEFFRTFCARLSLLKIKSSAVVSTTILSEKGGNLTNVKFDLLYKVNT